ncbi:hypothetical protein ACFZBU_06275 [Embleya sp. NPDC008237]|uniref:hypothetical protein n=1 Tax=Embleya sp. NPDC008237 TaxID=3363978 RepID=UPI0036E4A170
MLLQNKIHGAASQALRTRAYNLVQQIAAQNVAVNEMLTRQDIVLLIQVEPGVGDQSTVATLRNGGRTGITVTVHVDQGDPADKLDGDLLHELVLHAEPATARHLAAVALQQLPVHATDDDTIEAEETAEHEDPHAWYRMAGIALTFGNNLFERAIADTASHHPESAVMVLRMMVDANRITPEYASDVAGLI